ncbi:PREDICTED: uncharacterized protein LOC105556874 isoform X2 [Vollenhovia emeryi]|uniref:uncharacterized protein LOC105556874 isoform X2 n=1 Tax=Vollenhovia emeryi TaxID=411798 RepID=UPI0005F4793C|nr:PREDICTED: uncharacterized protein LOC105556874 isoform X2 [Vollenhovia emeryi]
MELHEFPVLIDETNVVTLLLTKDDMERATQDSAFLQNLVRKEQDVHNTNNIEPTDEVEDLTCENAVDKNKSDKSKTFVWPDKAVLLLIELYREREEEFSNGFKRSNKIWAEIAAEMNKVDPLYEVTAQQCTSKMSGLKRSYKNIVDMNKKSGNNRNSWAFFSYHHLSYTRLWIHYLATKRPLGLLQLPQVMAHRTQIKKTCHQRFPPLNQKVRQKRGNESKML